MSVRKVEGCRGPFSVGVYVAYSTSCCVYRGLEFSRAGGDWREGVSGWEVGFEPS